MPPRQGRASCCHLQGQSQRERTYCCALEPSPQPRAAVTTSRCVLVTFCPSCPQCHLPVQLTALPCSSSLKNHQSQLLNGIVALGAAQEGSGGAGDISVTSPSGSATSLSSFPEPVQKFGSTPEPGRKGWSRGVGLGWHKFKNGNFRFPWQRSGGWKHHLVPGWKQPGMLQARVGQGQVPAAT